MKKYRELLYHCKNIMTIFILFGDMKVYAMKGIPVLFVFIKSLRLSCIAVIIFIVNALWSRWKQIKVAVFANRPILASPESTVKLVSITTLRHLWSKDSFLLNISKLAVIVLNKNWVLETMIFLYFSFFAMCLLSILIVCLKWFSIYW